MINFWGDVDHHVDSPSHEFGIYRGNGLSS